MSFLILTVAGAVGCAARAMTRDLLVRAGWDSWVVILLVNLAGAAALGAIMACDGSWGVGTIRAGAGFLAGWTTYSAFAVDTVLLWGRGRRLAAACCWAATMAGAPLAAYAAHWVLSSPVLRGSP